MLHRAIALTNGNVNICNHEGTYIINYYLQNIEKNDVEIIQTLIEHKANLNHVFDGKTPLQ